MAVIQESPKMVYDAGGNLVEVILSAADFSTYLRTIADADGESLPRHLQDASDALLIEEVRAEKQHAVDLGIVLAGDGLE